MFCVSSSLRSTLPASPLPTFCLPGCQCRSTAPTSSRPLTGPHAPFDLKSKFEEMSWLTGEFAFATAFSPGAPATPEVFKSEILIPFLGNTEAENEKNPAIHWIRRLYFEAYTAAASDMQRRISPDAPDEKPAKILPPEERTARLNALKVRVEPGIKVIGELEPSNTLVDKFVDMKERDQLRYLQWDEYTRWDQEVEGVKQDPAFKIENGFFKTADTPIEATADIRTDLKVRTALQRRGLALEMAGLMSYAVHEEIVAWYMTELDRSALPGHEEVDLNQIRRADMEVWKSFAHQTRYGLAPVAGAPVLDAIVESTIREPRIAMLLNQLPGTNSKGAEGSVAESSRAEKRVVSEVQQLRNEIKKLKANNKGGGQKGAGGKGGKGGGKGAKGGKGHGPTMPNELRGM